MFGGYEAAKKADGGGEPAGNDTCVAGTKAETLARGKETDVLTVRVGADARYTDAAGFGFIDEKTRREQERLQLPELNSGFEPVWW